MTFRLFVCFLKSFKHWFGECNTYAQENLEKPLMANHEKKRIS